MSAIEELKKLEQQRAKLDEQHAKLAGEVKKELLSKAEAAVKELNDQGYNYRLVTGDSSTKATRTTGTRRSGVRDSVLAEIKKHPNGISRADLLAAMGATDEKAQQSVSNAVAALKKADQIISESGHYTAQG